MLGERRHVSSPGFGAFGERDWSRNKRGYIQAPTSGTDLGRGDFFPRPTKGSLDGERYPRPGGKPGRQLGGDHPLRGRGKRRQRGSSAVFGKDQDLQESGKGRRRGRYASLGTQPLPAAQTTPSSDAPQRQPIKVPGQEKPTIATGEKTPTPDVEGPMSILPPDKGIVPGFDVHEDHQIDRELEPLKQPPITLETYPDPKPPQTELPGKSLNPQLPISPSINTGSSASSTVPLGSSLGTTSVPSKQGAGNVTTTTALSPESLYMLIPAGKQGKLMDSSSGDTVFTVASEHAMYSPADGETYQFLMQSGPMVLQDTVSTTATEEKRLEIAANDKMRQDFAFAWTPSGGVPNSKASSTTFLQGFSATMKAQSDKSFEIIDMTMNVSKDAQTPPLVFSASPKALNEEFESGFTDGQPMHPATTFSGISRCPGDLIFGLEISPAHGGFETLDDMCVLAALSPEPWLKTLFKATTITFGGLAGTPARNAIWYTPGYCSNACIRLEAKVGLIGPLVNQLNKYISGWQDHIAHISAIARRNVIPIGGPSGRAMADGSLTIAIEPSQVDNVPHGLGAYVTFSEANIKFILVCYSDKLQWSFLKKWLTESCVEIATGFSTLESTLSSLSPRGDSTSLDHIMWRKVEITLGEDPAKEGQTIVVGVHIQLEANFQILVESGKHAVFTLDFTWDKLSGESRGRCAFDGTGPVFELENPPLQYLRGYERWDTLEYLVESEPFMSLRHISSTISEHVPFGVPTEIVDAYLSVSNKQILLHCTLEALLEKPTTTVTAKSSPFLQIDYSSMDVDLTINYAGGKPLFDAALNGKIGLLPYKEGNADAILGASILYQSQNQTIDFHAYAKNVPMTVLHSLFPEGDEREHAMAILEHITLVNFDFNVQHAKNENTISFDANIDIGGIMLGAGFSHSSSLWTFKASLEKMEAGQASKKLALGDVIDKLLGSDVGKLIPNFVTETEFTLATPGKDKVDVICTRITQPYNCLVFGAELQIGYLHVQFAQISPDMVNKGDGKTKATVKRLIRVSIGPLPTVPKLPIVGELDIPFDSLEFLWVSTEMSKVDISSLNQNLDMFKQQNISMKGDDTKIEAGFHFRLVGSKGVFLDHIFNNDQKKEEKKSEAQPSTTSKAKQETALTTISSGGNAASTTAALDKKKGPLTLSGIALSYEGGKLRIHLDASVLIGPMEAGIQGLNLIIDLSKVHGLHELLHIPIEIQIEGFDLSFNRSPVMLAGAFYHKPDTKAYYGGIAISLSNFSIAALGMYAQMEATADTPAYDSFFVYAMMEGLIFTVGWAEVRGLIAGFGYNSRLRLPTVQELPDFPLIQGFSTPGGMNLGTAMKKLTGPDSFMTPSRGSLWMALGLVIRACEMIDLRAVASLSLGPNQTEIGLIARATACLPHGSKPEDALVLIDLSVLGKLDIAHGELSVDGLINPTSFILNKDCRPVGGFAVRSWFGKNNPHQGDWMVSFGGFHPRYQVPAHYPVPQRLGISWHLSDKLSITGNAYAAVTPGAVMAGGMLHAVFAAGPFGAHFDAHADFLVNLKPLHYEADIAIFAGVYFEIRKWIIRKKFEMNIGASLHLEGPPIHGSVHFDMSLFSFDVNFGDGRTPKPEAISLYEMMNLVLKDSIAIRNGNVINDAHNFTVISGLVGENKNPDEKEDSKKKEPWIVRADNFIFQVRSAVPSNKVSLTNGRGGNYTHSNKQSLITCRPMQDNTGKLNATLNIELRHKDSTVPLQFQQGTEIEDNLPANYWGRFCEDRSEYMRPDPKKLPLSISHLVGMTVLPPKAKKSSNYMAIVKGASLEDVNVADDWEPEALNKKATRFVNDDNCRDSVKWSRVKGAMSGKPSGKQHKLLRKNILKSFMTVVHPGVDAESVKQRGAYRAIGSRVPSVILGDPERFYISPPTVFCK